MKSICAYISTLFIFIQAAQAAVPTVSSLKVATWQSGGFLFLELTKRNPETYKEETEKVEIEYPYWSLENVDFKVTKVTRPWGHVKEKTPIYEYLEAVMYNTKKEVLTLNGQVQHTVRAVCTDTNRVICEYWISGYRIVPYIEPAENEEDAPLAIPIEEENPLSTYEEIEEKLKTLKVEYKPIVEGSRVKGYFLKDPNEHFRGKKIPQISATIGKNILWLEPISIVDLSTQIEKLPNTKQIDLHSKRKKRINDWGKKFLKELHDFLKEPYGTFDLQFEGSGDSETIRLVINR